MVAVNDNGEQLMDVYRVSSWNCQHAFINICNIRGDDWAENVKPKLIFANDLPAMDALYHHQCSINFRIMKNIPRKYINSLTGNELEDKKGRPKDIERSKAFQLVVADFKENNDETITVSDLMEKMGTVCDNPYSNTHMEEELKKTDGIIITQIGNKKKLLLLRYLLLRFLVSFILKEIQLLEMKNGQEK